MRLSVVSPQTLRQTKIELKKLLPTFNSEVNNMNLFLTLFGRQMKLLDLGEDLWVPYLIGALPSDVTSLIARWLNELKIDSFDGLKNLMIANQMKKRCSPVCKEHYLDNWEELISPEVLADKLEAFKNTDVPYPVDLGDTREGK
ncbi:uncharacterized protein TNCV_954561 [Trichonephila clavipes]|nr:uncharacterized protein TNCV_954561 [Trichonephila clavipes]